MAEAAAIRKRRKPGYFVGLVIAVVVALVWSVASLPGTLRDALSGQVDEAYGYVLGYNLFPAIVITAVLWVANRRAINFGRGVVCFIVILLAASAPELAMLPQALQRQADQKAQYKTAAGEIRSTISGLLQSSAPAVDTKVKAQGEAGEIERLVKQLTAQLVADRQGYLDEVKATGFPEFLRPQNLAADPSMRRPRAKLRQIRQLVAKYRTLERGHILGFRDSVMSARLSDAEKQAMAAGLDKSLATTIPLFDRGWDLEDGVVVEEDESLALLARRQGHWEVVKGKLEFADPADLAVFRAHQQNIQRMGAEQKSIKQQGADMLRQGLQRMQQDVQ